MKSTKIIMAFTIAATIGVVALVGASAHPGHHHKDKGAASATDTNGGAANSANTQKEENKANLNTSTPPAQKSSPSGHKK